MVWSPFVKALVTRQEMNARNHASKVGGLNRAKPESRAKPEEQGRSLGRGLGEPFPRKFLEF